MMLTSSPILLVAIWLSLLLLVDSQCPVPKNTRCKCIDGPKGKGRIISCKDANLKVIPKFNPSDELFSEIIFSNGFDPISGRCLSCNKIKILPADAFKGIKFEAIDLSRNSLVEVSQKAFRGLETVLKTVIMEGDDTMGPPYEAVSRLLYLQRLVFSRFAQGTINRENTNIDSLLNLEDLELKQMDIEEITPDAFVNRLPSLKTLTLESLPLKYFPVEGIAPLKSLEELAATSVDLDTIPRGAFKNLNNLRKLILSNNKIGKLEEGCFDGIQDTLEFLGLKSNMITNHESQELAMYRWSRLEHVNLGHNSITNLPRGLFYNMNRLSRLHIDSNKISTIDKNDFQGMDNLLYLDISYNQLEGIQEGTFENTPKLKEIYLRGENTLTPSKVFNLNSRSLKGLGDSLQKLILTDSKLDETNMWAAVRQMKNIELLELGGTSITEIPDFQFMYSKNLKYLMLENNKITDISQLAMAGLENILVTINLQKNQIQVIDKCAFGGLTQLRNIYLGGNPLKCDCKALWLHGWIEERKANDAILESLTNANCDNGKFLTSLSPQELCPVKPMVEDTCISYSDIVYPATQPPTTTLRPTIQPSAKSFRFRKVIEESRSAFIEWEFRNYNEIDTLVMEYQHMQEQYMIAYDIPRGALSFKATDLEPNSNHLFCLKIHYRNSAKKDIRPCIVVNTLP